MLSGTVKAILKGVLKGILPQKPKSGE